MKLAAQLVMGQENRTQFYTTENVLLAVWCGVMRKHAAHYVMETRKLHMI